MCVFARTQPSSDTCPSPRCWRGAGGGEGPEQFPGKHERPMVVVYDCKALLRLGCGPIAQPALVLRAKLSALI